MLRIFCVLAAFLLFTSISAQEMPEDSGASQDTEQISGAAIIIQFQKFIASDQQRLIQMKSRSGQLAQEIEVLTRQFNILDAQQERDEAVGSASGDEALEKRREKVLSSLDLHLRSRQTIEQQIIIVQGKIEKQKGVVNYITVGQVRINIDSVQMLPSAGDTTVQSLAISETQNRKEQQAEEELHRLNAELMHAKSNLLIVDQLIRWNKEDLDLAEAMTEVSQRLLELYKLQSQAEGERRSLSEITRRVSQDTALISALKVRIKNLESFRDPVVEVVNEAEEEVETARSHLEFLRSSMAPHRIAYWIRFNLPKIAIILVGFFLLSMLSRWVVKIILNRMIKRKIGIERTERLETLKLASSSIITIIAVFIGFLVLLSEVGVDLTVVLGGAAVISLVIAFGAQSLVKDYFSGFMILFENQYRVGNVVKINKTVGVVENMSLRLSVLRDLEGVTHFIPHGQILEVSNLTHGWSRVVFDIGISYNEKVDNVMGVLQELGAQMKDDSEYGQFIIGDLEMLGVDKFAESAIVIKFLVKTRPLKQWIVKRELLRRIKNRFDELGIEIPYPQLTVYHRDLEKKPDSFSPSNEVI
ncbi:mechanosensitive ion channel [Marivirga sp. S37H4]|uniref:Mechanosensitive ion channel n=1 Tax=Marivirga aurantiaca TaxID=2802615 RepID=A0A935CCI7_9BACT|nr:mechanosensitive ion channel family protein [Marivirga aurantiaca]MBK6266068.1 mechanosensitive ion channel [Marivirga aurantiaca]